MILTFGLLIALVWLVLLCSDAAGRRTSFGAMAALTLSWLLYIASWSPALSPSLVIWRVTGEVIPPEHIWAATDCACGVLIAWAFGTSPLGALIYGGFVLTCSAHLYAEAAGAEFETYAWIVNVIFTGQLVAVLVAGGGGIVRRITRHIDRSRHGLGQDLAARRA